MKLKIFDVVIDSHDNLEDRQSSMDLIYKYVGKKVLKSWQILGDEIGLVDKTNSNDVWVWLKNIELLDWDNLKESIYMKEYKDIKDEQQRYLKNKFVYILRQNFIEILI